MTFTRAIAPELPFLRRYARALTGSQALGDAAVRETLEALLESPAEFDTEQAPRVELYRVFHKLWLPKMLREVGGDDPFVNTDAAGRQALLLTAVEGFSIGEASTILALPPGDVEDALNAARREIESSLQSRILIIEDEAIIAMHIQSIVGDAGHEVVGVAQTRKEAVALAAQTSPELVLADISLADGSSGIDAVREILELMDVPVIFVTAFPERLLTGERPEPTYLITKPFEPLMLMATISQALMAPGRRTQEAA